MALMAASRYGVVCLLVKAPGGAFAEVRSPKAFTA